MAPVTLNGFRVAKVRSGARGCRRRSPTATHASSKSSTGLGLLEWAGGNTQGTVVKLSKFVWKEIWRAMVRELAPQAKGSYSRPSDPFISEGMELGDIHYLYTGNGKVVLVLKRKELFSYPDSLLCHSVSTIQLVLGATAVTFRFIFRISLAWRLFDWMMTLKGHRAAAGSSWTA